MNWDAMALAIFRDTFRCLWYRDSISFSVYIEYLEGCYRCSLEYVIRGFGAGGRRLLIQSFVFFSLNMGLGFRDGGMKDLVSTPPPLCIIGSSSEDESLPVNLTEGCVSHKHMKAVCISIKGGWFLCFCAAQQGGSRG